MPEVMDSSNGVYQTCTGQPFGEDPNCSDGLLLKDSITDHTHYMLYDGQPFDIGQFCLSDSQREMVKPAPANGFRADSAN